MAGVSVGTVSTCCSDVPRSPRKHKAKGLGTQLASWGGSATSPPDSCARPIELDRPDRDTYRWPLLYRSHARSRGGRRSSQPTICAFVVRTPGTSHAPGVVSLTPWPATCSTVPSPHSCGQRIVTAGLITPPRPGTQDRLSERATSAPTRKSTSHHRTSQSDDRRPTIRTSAPTMGAAAGCRPEYATVVGFLAYTGLRWGEMAALRVDSFDLLRRRVHITEAVAEVRGKLVWGTPKDHERRSVPFPAFLAQLLAELMEVKGGSDPGLHRRQGAPCWR